MSEPDPPVEQQNGSRGNPSKHPTAVPPESPAFDPGEQPSKTANSLQKRLAAWCVHLLTVSGIIFTFLALLAVANHNWREVFLWLFVVLVIDGVDGSLARIARVNSVLPHIDGKMMDSVIDFTSYALVPAFFFQQAGLAPSGWGIICAVIMLLAAVIYYGKSGMIANSMHFVGFPVLWNVFVFFDFFILVLPGWANVLLVIFFAILHFVPIKFSYPSRATRWRGLTLFISIVMLFAAALVIIEYPERSLAPRIIASIAALYFLGLALWETYADKKTS